MLTQLIFHLDLEHWYPVVQRRPSKASARTQASISLWSNPAATLYSTEKSYSTSAGILPVSKTSGLPTTARGEPLMAAIFSREAITQWREIDQQLGYRWMKTTNSSFMLRTSASRVSI